MRTFVLSAVVAVALSGAAQAATLTEPLTGFSSNFNAGNGFTDVGNGFDVITGTLIDSEDDFLRFTDLAAGAQTLTFDFALTSTANNAQASGVVRYWDVMPTNNEFTGGTATSGFNMNPFSATTSSQTISLDNSFAGGELFVAILSFSSNGLPYSYTVTAPGNASAVAPVPLPSAGLLLLSAFGLMGLRRRFRRGDLHPGQLQAT